MTKLVTIKDVPLLRVGTFNASTGEFSADTAMLESIVSAWASGYTNDPVLKLGHKGHRAEDDSGRAYGQVSNLRVADEGKTLIGDYVNVPEDIAAELPSAYPYRSVELALGVKRRDENGKVVEEYPAVLTALALLGDTAPAVAGLGVTPAIAASAMSNGMTVESTTVVLASLPGGRSVNYLRDALQEAFGGAVLDFTDTDVFFESTGSSTGVLGSAYRIDSVTGELVPEGDPYEVDGSTLYRNTAAPGGAPAPSEADPGNVPVANASDVPHSTPAGANDRTDSIKEENMENLAALLTEEQMTSLGIDANTPDEEVFAELLEYAFREPEAPATAAAATGIEDGQIIVSAAVHEDMTTRIADLEARETARLEEARVARVEAALSGAVDEGRIHESETETWRSAFAADEENAHRLLALRAPAFNTSELGYATARPHLSGGDQNAAFDEFFASMNITGHKEV